MRFYLGICSLVFGDLNVGVWDIFLGFWAWDWS